MSETPRTNTIAPVGYARAQDLLLYREVWAGYSNKPADENGHPPVALYTQDQVNAMLTAERERADRNQEDAERYRWLQSEAKQVYMHPNAEIDNRMRWEFPVLIALTCINSEVSLNAAIDAARRK